MSQRQQDIPSRSLRHAVGESELAAEGTFIEADAEEPVAPRVSSPGRDAWRRFRHNWAAMLSGAVFLLMVLVAIFAPFLHTTSAYTMNFALLHGAPSAQHWFGTDELGRDEYSRLLYGLRVPLAVGTIGAVLTVILGMLFGLSPVTSAASSITSWPALPTSCSRFPASSWR
jgi:ABC-type antimicrobial peptide transport system permease subunit